MKSTTTLLAFVFSLTMFTLACGSSSDDDGNPSPTLVSFPDLSMLGGTEVVEGALGARSIPGVGDIDAAGFVSSRPVQVEMETTVTFSLPSDDDPSLMFNNIWAIDPEGIVEVQGDLVRFGEGAREFLRSNTLDPRPESSYPVDLEPGYYQFFVSAQWTDGRQASWAFYVEVIAPTETP